VTKLLDGGGDRRRQFQVATCDIPTEDSSGCAVSLCGDDRRSEARWYAVWPDPRSRSQATDRISTQQ